MPLEEESDERLLAAIADRNRDAFRALMQRHAPAIMALAERVTGSAEDADEIVQETLLKLWTGSARWRPGGPAQFSTWLHRVVLNACIDRRRRRPNAPLEGAATIAGDEPAGDDVIAAVQRRRAVESALAELPSRQRAVVSLHYFGELSAPSVAEILGLSLATVESLLVRGRKGLRQALTRRGIANLRDVL